MTVASLTFAYGFNAAATEYTIPDNNPNIAPVAISDLDVHQLYINGLALNKADQVFNPTIKMLVPGVSSFINGFLSDTDHWTVTVTNTGPVAWVDFHVRLMGDTIPIGCGPEQQQCGLIIDDSATASGAFKNVKTFTRNPFATSLDIADPDDPVKPNGSFTFDFSDEVRANYQGLYHIEIQASVPEPASLVVLGVGIAGLGFVRARLSRPKSP